MKVLLRYAEEFNNSAVGSVSLSQYWRLSCYDPDASGTGAQPNGFDQWMAFYNYFLVVRGRIKVNYTSNDHLVAVSLTPCITATTINSFVKAIGDPGTVYGQSVVGAPAIKLDTGWVNVSSYLGTSVDEMRSEQRYWGTNAADPTEFVSVTQLSGTHDGATTYHESYFMEMMLEVEFFDRVTLVQS